MRRPRNSSSRASNPLRELLAERSRTSDFGRGRRRDQEISGDLPSLIEERVGEHMEMLETKLVENFREMGQRVVEQSTQALTSQLDGRITQLEQISALQTETVDRLRDSSKISSQKVSGVVNRIEQALGEAVPGFQLPPPAYPSPEVIPPTHQLVPAEDRSLEDGRVPNVYCPKCTSKNVRRSARSGMWEEFLRLFFISPFRCRACRHKFYRF